MTRPRIGLTCLLFFCSGISGLGYQIIWSRQFGLGLGTEMASVLAVVGAFMGGMAVGSLGFDKVLSRSAEPGRWYACLEIGIGLWAFISSWLMPAVQVVGLKAIGLEPSFARHWVVAFCLPFLTLLPATVAMGATLPAMDRWIAPYFAEHRAIGLIYAVNTFGAVIGTLLSAFVLLPTLGFKSSIGVFAAINVCCGLAAFWLRRAAHSGQQGKLQPVSRGNLRVTPDATGTSSCPPASSSWDPSMPSARLARANDAPMSRREILTLCMTGFLGLGYEAVGIRALSQVLENTIYTFAFVLAVYLLGTAAGGALYQRFLKARPAASTLQFLLLSLSSACALGGIILSRAQWIYDMLRQPPDESAPAQVFLAVLVFGLPTLFMGATFSHLVQNSRRLNGGVGFAAAFNILGGTLGPFIFGVLLLPLVGIKLSLLLIGIGYLTLLPALLKPGWAISLPLVLALLLGLLPFQIVQIPPGAKVAVYKEGTSASVAVLEDTDGNRTLRVNNRFQMGGTGAAAAEYRHAHIPLLLHPNPGRALVLGLGTGISLGGTGFHPNLRTDGVELLPEVIEVMPQFEPFNRSPLRNPAMRVYAADARRFVQTTTNLYDVVISDLFHPAMDGAGALYTVEHFQAIRRRLAAGGIFCQWLPLHQLDDDMLRVIVRTFLEVFPEAQAYLLRFNVDAPVLGLVGFTTAPVFSPAWIENRAGSPELEEQLRSQSLADSIRVFGCLLAGAGELRSFAADAPLNSDDFPRVMFGAPHFAHLKNGNSYGRLLALLKIEFPDPGKTLGLKGGPEAGAFSARLKTYFAARAVYVEGLVAQVEGRPDAALNAFVESARLSPDFTPGYAHALSVASLLARSRPEEARALLERLAAAQPSRPVAREMLQRLFGN